MPYISKPVLNPLLSVGAQMSNLCHNLSQDSNLQTRHRDYMRELYKQWDQAKQGLKAELTAIEQRKKAKA